MHIILTNTRCIHQIKAYNNDNKSPVEEHNPCSFFNTSLHKNLATTFVWDTYIKCMMECSNNDCEPNIKESVKFVSKEIFNFVKIMPVNPVCLELDQILKNMNI